jgi:hypothetical protein
MAEELISLYIDDELDLDEKILFVEKVYDSRRFKDETVELLWQEKQLRTPPPVKVPDALFSSEQEIGRRRRGRLYAVAGGLAAAALVFLMLWGPAYLQQGDRKIAHRFVVYLPDTETAAIAGSFNEWQKLPMQKAGPEGYWEIALDLPPGEHRYSFILDDGRRVADPTVWAREKDDFGTENSVLDLRI